MLAGQTLPECQVCNNKLLNTSVYRDYFWHLFKHKYDQAVQSTLPDGTTTMQPVSWDYRFSNLCNFKCRTCGDMLSSSWESENRQHDTIDFGDSGNSWLRPNVRREISQFQDQQVEEEFRQAVEQHRVEEIYWAGGEPLMYEQHWKYMRRIIELGDGPRVYARYNTNLSKIQHQGTNLYSDILAHVRDWQICASLDGTGEIGEYIRTGLDYERWLDNFHAGLAIARDRRNMRIDFTLTLPGMFEVTKISQLGKTLDAEVLAKVIFSFSPNIVMSPLALPRHLLHPWLDQLIPGLDGALKDTLVQLKNRPTFEEQWPEQYRDAVFRGKQRLLRLERIRGDVFTMEHILNQRREVYDWWKNI
jgi:hypothetical protein